MAARAMKGLLLCALLVAPLPACDESVEVRGQVDRVVGETVTLELVEGSKSYSGKVTLVGADNTAYDTARLKVSLKHAKKLTFVIPPDVAQGQAHARVGYADDYTAPADGSFNPLTDAGSSSGGFDYYDVPLNINRLAMTMDSKGILGILPLPPATITGGSQAVGNGVAGMISLSTDGGTLAMVAADQIKLLAMGRTPKNLGAPISQTGARCLAALPGGMLVGTDTQVIWLRYVAGKGITRAKDFNLRGCHDISVDAAGTTALVLSRWDSNGDSVADADALTELSLGTTPAAFNTLKVDGAPGALGVTISGDAKTAVIADGGSIYGVSLKGSGQFSFTKLPWGTAAKPVAMAATQGMVLVSGQKVYLHAVAESANNKVRFVASDRGQIKWVYSGDKVQEVDLGSLGTPAAMAFGRRAELYVAMGSALYLVKDLQGAPAVSPLNLKAANTITDLVVQP